MKPPLESFLTGTPKQPTGKTRPPISSFGGSQAALAHSQGAIDKMRTDAQEAELAAQQAQAPSTIAKETTKGTVGTLANSALKFAQSAVRAPIDIAKSLMGKDIGTETLPNFTGEGQKTIQGEFMSETLPAVEAGEMTPLAGTAKTVGDTLLGAADIAGGVGLTKVGAATAEKAPGVLKQVAEKTGVAKFFSDRAEKKALESTIDAVYSSPTGAKFKKTSSQILTGQREITPASIFREQGITPEQQTVNLATRLKDLGLGKDPVKNTQVLADDFAETEEMIQKALVGDPEVKYLADKPTLIGKLTEVKTGAPEEFRIKDSQMMVNRVVDFANRIVEKAEDSIGGVREARKSFDAQAKREFPNAFKPDGSVDTKTPAGYAIKKTRDDINEHLYNTAPNGSEIQTLIGREADLYRAAQVAVEKAAKGEGKNALGQWIKANPQKARVLEAAGILTLGATGWSLVKPD